MAIIFKGIYLIATKSLLYATVLITLYILFRINIDFGYTNMCSIRLALNESNYLDVYTANNLLHALIMLTFFRLITNLV